MPFKEPVKLKDGYVLPKKEGGFHRSKNGKVVKFKSKKEAHMAAAYIMSHGL